MTLVLSEVCPGQVGSGRDADPRQRQLLGPSFLAESPVCLLEDRPFIHRSLVADMDVDSLVDIAQQSLAELQSPCSYRYKSFTSLLRGAR